MATIKKVNVYPSKPISGLPVQISTPAIKVSLTTVEILKCILSDAKVEEILPDGSTIRLNLNNYDKENVSTGNNNESFNSLISSIANILSDSITTNIAVSGEAIKKYVKYKISEIVTTKFIENIAYDSVNKILKYTTGDPEDSVHKVPITGFVSNVSYKQETNQLIFDVGDRKINVDIPTAKLETGVYNSDLRKIILKLSNGNNIAIPLTELINSSDLTSTDSISISKTPLGKFLFDIKISNNVNNAIEVKKDGLFVEDKSINKIDKVELNREDEVILSNTDGSVKVSGVKIGKAEISPTVNDKTLLTESAALKEIKRLEDGFTSLSINNEIVDSKTINYNTPSKDKLVSEEAYVKSLSFGTF